MREPSNSSHDPGLHAYVELRLHFPPDSDAIKETFGSSDGLYGVGEKDRISYLSAPIGFMRVPLLLLALSRNAVKDGIRQNQLVDVYFVKTAAHDLRVANKIPRAQVGYPEAMRKKYLDKPPANVTDGISLWNVSRYIQAVAAAYLDSCLGKLRGISPEGRDSNKAAKRFAWLYRRLTSQEFALLIKCVPVHAGQGADDEVFFCVDLPLLEEKYNAIEREETGS